MQVWTKEKPNRAGKWWAKIDEATQVLDIIEHDGVLQSKDFYGSLKPVNGSYFSSIEEWGSAPISEPATRKY